MEFLYDKKQTLRQNKSDSAKIIRKLATLADVSCQRGGKGGGSVAKFAGEKIADAVFGAGAKLGHPLRGLGADTLRGIVRKYCVDAAQRIRLRRRSGGPQLLFKHLGRPIGITDEVVVFIGAETVPEFYNNCVKNVLEYDPADVERGVVGLVGKHLAENPDIGAIVCEGVNFAPYGGGVQEATGLPWFDIVDLTNMVYAAVVKRRHVGFL